jgi:hypothetical protein
MPTLPTSHHESTLAAEEEFLAIVYADEDLLQAEFDAIIAAEWPSPAPDTPADDDAGERSPGRARRQPKGDQARLPNRARHPGIGGWSRQRSPPPRGQAQRKTGRKVMSRRESLVTSDCLPRPPVPPLSA